MEKLDVSGTEDRPINKATDDLFSMHDKFVEPVYNYIGNNSEGAVTIAVSGEWGSGKSSAINLLKERLRKYEPHDKKNIIVNFDLLLEAKFEVPQLVALFFRDLAQSIADEKIRIDLKILSDIMIELGLNMLAIKYPLVAILKHPIYLLSQKSFDSKKSLRFSERAEEISKKKEAERLLLWNWIWIIIRQKLNMI